MKRKILVIENESIYRELIPEMIICLLRDMGQEADFHFAVTEASGLALIFYYPEADLIILDGRLDLGHGRNILRVVRKVNSACLKKIIVYTGQKSREFFDSLDDATGEGEPIMFINDKNVFMLRQAIISKLGAESPVFVT